MKTVDCQLLPVIPAFGGACAHLRQYAIVYYYYYNSVLLQPHDTIFILTIKLKMFIDRIYYYTTVTCVYIYFIKIDNEI